MIDIIFLFQMLNEFQRKQLELLAFELGQDPLQARTKAAVEAKIALLKQVLPPERGGSA